jgi:flavin-dependent dehydrogenase
MSEASEVLIVGGGPAGATCARLLARAGMDVAVVDKANFPRDKTCAGWITPAVVQETEMDLEDYASSRVLAPVLSFRTGLIGGRVVSTRYDQPVSYGIRRCEFDDYLLRRSGARLSLGEPVKSIERSKGEWIVNGRRRARLLVGAGGHFCPAARTLSKGAAGEPRTVFAQEIEFRTTPEQQAACNIDATTAELYFCGDLLGYGWCFRKGDYLNVGLGREDRESLTSRVQEFRAFLCARGAIPPNAPTRFHGHAYLLYEHSTRPPVGEGWMLIGDSAGLAYGRSGEGIRPAVESGILAAQTILEAQGDYSAGRLAAYEAKLRGRFGARRGEGGEGLLGRIPVGVQEWIARFLMTTNWFTRRVLLERWFLHMTTPPLASAVGA